MLSAKKTSTTIHNLTIENHEIYAQQEEIRRFSHSLNEQLKAISSLKAAPSSSIIYPSQLRTLLELEISHRAFALFCPPPCSEKSSPWLFSPQALPSFFSPTEEYPPNGSFSEEFQSKVSLAEKPSTYPLHLFEREKKALLHLKEKAQELSKLITYLFSKIQGIAKG